MRFLEDPDVSDQVYWQDIVSYYYQCLKNSPEALNYLHSRGLSDPDMIDAHSLGYADRSLGNLIPHQRSIKGKAIRQRLIKLGVFMTTGHELFRGSVVMPIKDEHGNIVNMYGRKIGKKLRRGTLLHTYADKSFPGVWNIEALKADTILLTESPINALSLWCIGFRAVTCSFHGSDVPASLEDALIRSKAHKLVLVRKRIAGDEEEVIESVKCLAKRLCVFRALLPIGEDVNDFIQGKDNASSQLARIIEKAEWLIGEKPAPEADQNGSLKHEDRLGSQSEVDQDIRIDNRVYKARGLEKNLSPGTLKVTLSVSRSGSIFMDSINLCSARQRKAFIRQAAEEVYMDEDDIKSDMATVLIELEERQEALIAQALKPTKPQPVELTEAEKEEALEFLKSPDLLERIVNDYEHCGLVGERTNVLVSYLAATSRLLDTPLAITIQSSSAAGKTSLLNAILSFFPPEDVVSFSALSPQSLFYFADGQLKRKIMAVAEEEGVQRSSYALKLLVSEGHLKIATVGKEEITGRTKAEFYIVEGPTALFMTTTSLDIDEELQNRTLLLTVDESRDQTRAIHHVQRISQTIEGLLERKEREERYRIHRNAQRMLKPLAIVNNYAAQLSFLDTTTRLRRDHQKYLSLIQSVALLRQYQKSIKSVEHKGKSIEYVEVDTQDIEIANTLAHEVLGRSLDELAPQTRKLLDQLHDMVSTECDKLGIDQKEYRFTRRKVREHTGWSYGQVRIHMQRLVDMEYIGVHSGSKGQRFQYELVFDIPDDTRGRFLQGLTDSKRLKPAQESL